MRDLHGLGADQWHDLRDRVTGLFLPGTDEYERRSRPAGQRFQDMRPSAVVACRSTADVAAAVAFARDRRLPVAIRSGGHDFACRSSGTGMVLDLGELDRIAVDGTRAAVGVGARLGQVYRALNQRGRTVPAGSGGTVGIGGLTLGGGLGILGRMHGLVCDRLIAAEVVLVDGRVVWSDEHRHPDLFWAIRGGGAMGVGVVTELVFDTVVAPPCTVFHLRWHWEDAAQVVDAWQQWAPDAPDEVAASLLLNAPADDSQAPTVTLFGSAADTHGAATGDALAGFAARVGAAPQERWLQESTWLGAKDALAARAPGGHDGALFSRSEYFRASIPRGVVTEVVESLGTDRRPGEARELDLSPWGGAYNRTPAHSTAFPHRDERFLLKHAVTLKPDLTGGLATQPSGWLDRSWRAVHPFGSGGVYPNFPDPALRDAERAYYGSNLERLRRVKSDYDPTGVLPSAAPLPHLVD